MYTYIYMQREETGEKTTRLVPQWPGIDRGGVVFHELSRPRYPRVKFQWLFDRAPAARAALPTCMNCKTLSRGATPPPAALLPWVFARCETMLRGYSMDWFVCALSRVIPIRFVEHVFETIVSIDPRRAKSFHRWFDTSHDFYFSSSSNLESLIRGRERERGIFYTEENSTNFGRQIYGWIFDLVSLRAVIFSSGIQFTSILSNTRFIVITIDLFSMRLSHICMHCIAQLIRFLIFRRHRHSRKSEI